MENKSLKLSQDYFNLHQLIQKTFGIVRHQAKEKNIKLVAEVKNNGKTHHVFCLIKGDERRYQQILVNFLSNALKFSGQDSKIKIKL
jgi:signal transduction histidine kinase